MHAVECAEIRETDRLPSHDAFLSQKYFSSLDTFRFLSIVAVIWHHSEEGVWWFPASGRGFLGVDFFFVISGFLIVTLLLRERERAGVISLRRFYLRRSLRIFPIYYAMLGGLTAFFLFVRPQSSMARPFFADLPYQAFYLSNFVQASTILFFTWSLASEEQFYLVWPPVEKWLRGAVVPVLLGVILINQMINFRLLDSFLSESLRGRFIFQITFTPICLGVLLAHVLHAKQGFVRVAAWLGRPWVSLALLGTLVLACNNPIPDLSGWPRLVIQLVMALLLASAVIREDHGLNRLFGFAWVRRIGVISYGMYIYHEFAAHAANAVIRRLPARPPLGFFVLTLVLTIAVAELSFRLYETPFLRLKDVLGHGAVRRDRLKREAEQTGESPALQENRA